MNDNDNDDKCISCQGRGQWEIVGEELEVLKSLLGKLSIYEHISSFCVDCNSSGSEKKRQDLLFLRKHPILHQYEINWCPDEDECRWCKKTKHEHLSLEEQDNGRFE